MILHNQLHSSKLKLIYNKSDLKEKSSLDTFCQSDKCELYNIMDL